MVLERYRFRLERLRRLLEENVGYIRVAQPDGSNPKFRPNEVRAAYVNYCQMIEALGADEEVEPHPFNVAVANSSDLSLKQSAFGIPALTGLSYGE